MKSLRELQTGNSFTLSRCLSQEDIRRVISQKKRGYALR